MIVMTVLYLQVYLSWANSVLSEEGLVLENLTEFQNGVLLCRLLDLLHPPAALLEKIQVNQYLAYT